jgi:hypothetical protein
VSGYPDRSGAYVKRLTGSAFRCDDGGTALVVNRPTEPIDALIDLVVYAFGGTWARSNPTLVEASAQVRTEVWHSCTKRWREDMGVDDDCVDTWWSPEGDGARQVLVAFYPGDLYDLGEAASAADNRDLRPGGDA